MVAKHDFSSIATPEIASAEAIADILVSKKFIVIVEGTNPKYLDTNVRIYSSKIAGENIASLLLATVDHFDAMSGTCLALKQAQTILRST